MKLVLAVLLLVIAIALTMTLVWLLPQNPQLPALQFLTLVAVASVGAACSNLTLALKDEANG